MQRKDFFRQVITHASCDIVYADGILLSLIILQEGSWLTRNGAEKEAMNGIKK